MEAKRPACTEEMRTWAKEAAEALGLEPEDFGGMSMRIGGASDLADHPDVGVEPVSYTHLTLPTILLV